MSDFARIVVQLPELPTGPNEDEDEVLDELRSAADGGVLRRLLAGGERLSELLTAGAQAQGVTQRRVAALAHYSEETLRALGQAWLDAGAPGKPQVVEQIEVRLDSERDRFRADFSSLMGERDHALLEAEARGEVAQRQQHNLMEQLERMEAVLDHLQAGIRASKSAGLFRALDVLERLPGPLKSGIPRTDLGALQRWTTALHDRLRIQQEELELRIAMARTREVQALSQEVHVDKEALGKALEMHQAQERTADELTQFLRGVGRKLVPMAHTFANGSDTVAALTAARQMHAETKERAEELAELIEALRERSSR